MAEYKCYSCNKPVRKEYSERKQRCPYCGGRMFYKPRTVVTKIKAR